VGDKHPDFNLFNGVECVLNMAACKAPTPPLCPSPAAIPPVTAGNKEQPSAGITPASNNPCLPASTASFPSNPQQECNPNSPMLVAGSSLTSNVKELQQDAIRL